MEEEERETIECLYKVLKIAFFFIYSSRKIYFFINSYQSSDYIDSLDAMFVSIICDWLSMNAKLAKNNNSEKMFFCLVLWNLRIFTNVFICLIKMKRRYEYCLNIKYLWRLCAPWLVKLVAMYSVHDVLMS